MKWLDIVCSPGPNTAHVFINIHTVYVPFRRLCHVHLVARKACIASHGLPLFFQTNVFSAMYKRNGKFMPESLFPLATLFQTKKKKAIE